MGEVIALRTPPPADVPVAHPALRWIAGDAYWVAHRVVYGQAACGAPGVLFQASKAVPLCTDCWPQDQPR